MSTQTTILLLGTNLGDKKKNLENAITNLCQSSGTVIKRGEITETEPVEFTSKNMFLNQLITLETHLSPISLLKVIKEIEQKMGRTYTKPLKGEKYVSRIIDIDILSYDSLIFYSKKLEIPHKQVGERAFVIQLLSRYEES